MQLCDWNHLLDFQAYSRASRFRSRGSVQTAFLLGALLLSQTAAAGPTFVVNSTGDVPAGPNTTDGVCETASGNGVCTLRAAIMEANGSIDAIVRVPAGLYVLTRISTGDGHPENGDLDVLVPMKIEGDGPSVSVVDAGARSRVFVIATGGGQVEIRGLTIRNGLVDLATYGEGGGILVGTGQLVLENVHVKGSRATAGGGISVANGFLPPTSLTLRHGIIEGNQAASAGGGLNVGIFSYALIQDSRIDNNTGSYSGGGVYTARNSSVRIERTGIIGNSTDLLVAGSAGAGIESVGDLEVISSLIHDNSSGTGGGSGIIGWSGTNLAHVTMSANRSAFSALTNASSGSMSLANSIVTSNPVSAAHCFGRIYSYDYNFIESLASCPLVGVVDHVALGAGFDHLSFNGGFSPDVSSFLTRAQGAVPFSSCTEGPLGSQVTTDIRGHRRKAPNCDIGAHDASAIYTPAQLIGVNLVRNGGGIAQELGLADNVANPADVDLYRAPYWAQQNRMVQLLYGAPGGYPSRSNAPPGSGYKFFAGGEDSFTIGKQGFDISAIAGQIDAGNLPYEVSGAFGGYLTNNDRATLVTEFFNASGQFISAFSLGGFSAADRGNQTRLIRAERRGNVPVGTRFIDLTLYFERFDGLANDGYADAISVTLPEPGTAASLGAALTALAGLARRRHRRP